jgi:hypothetical protein
MHGNSIIIADEDNGNYKGERDFTCYADSGAAQTITIDCGNGEIHTGTNVASLNATCHFNENTIGIQRTVQCTVDGNTNKDCRKNVIIDQKSFGMCGDGQLDEWENCDLGANQEIRSYLDGEHHFPAGEYANK